MQKTKTSKDIQGLIDRLVPSQCGINHEYCLLKKITEARFKTNPRELIQMKCVELFKWEINQHLKEEIDISDVWVRWAEKGFASAFKEIYDENGPDVPIKDLYNMVRERVK